MLSIADIKRELGKNIFIYPLNPSAVKANSIDLHASRFAWSINTKKSLYDSTTNTITIPAHDTALIYTEEAIFVSNKIGGTYHSKVRWVSNGIGHVSGSLDAQYVGLSIIAMHNVSDTPKEIKAGSEFVTISLYYLHSEDYQDTISHDNPPGHPSLIANFEGFTEFQQWEEQNRWCRSKGELYLSMTNSAEYVELKKQFEQEQIVFNKKFWKRKTFKYIIVAVSWLVANILLAIPAYFADMGAISAIACTLMEKASIPLIVSMIIPMIVSDIREKNWRY